MHRNYMLGMSDTINLSVSAMIAHVARASIWRLVFQTLSEQHNPPGGADLEEFQTQNSDADSGLNSTVDESVSQPLQCGPPLPRGQGGFRVSRIFPPVLFSFPIICSSSRIFSFSTFSRAVDAHEIRQACERPAVIRTLETRTTPASAGWEAATLVCNEDRGQSRRGL